MHKYSNSDPVRRRETILRIVAKRAVSSQEELLAILHAEGFDTTQPTLSRDIRELGLAKTPNGYAAIGQTGSSSTVIPFTTPETRENRLNRALAEFAVSIEQAGNLVVVRTRVAAAQPLALALDSAAIPQVAGTIAGDDTIFLAVRSTTAASKLVRQFRESIAPPRRERRTTRA
ncbi:MAG TPA: arginine repressor [Thermoanaerobaculia bacterium]|nr:arginine repressor [Thermoanaerobaculia bacterium]